MAAKKDELKHTSELVKAILKDDKQCRNSDSFLYLKVLQTTAKKKGIDLDTMTVPHFLTHLHGTVFPGFETVRRSRQKMQERYPELSANEVVEGFRAENETAYREYARGVSE